tara:strand:- start:1984 stop:2520 length:537 start_codon:yes stop_codon:yes gene_type:complete
MNTISSHSAICLSSYKSKDLHDKVNGFVFPLQHVLWLNYGLYNSELNKFEQIVITDQGTDEEVTTTESIVLFKWSARKDGVWSDFNEEITDITDYDTLKIPEFSSFESTGIKEFYYYIDKLYTNFDLIEYDTGDFIFAVEYFTKADSVSLDINIHKGVTGIPLIDNYELEIIGIDVRK